MYINTMPIILASASPRRKLLLEQVGIVPKVIPSPVEEEGFLKDIDNPSRIVESLARAKAQWVIDRTTLPRVAVLAADTVVTLEGKLLGKPADAGEARAMLSSLSGSVHQVWTGVCVAVKSRKLEMRTWSCCTEVEFRKISGEEIDAYVLTGEPFDKAGGYGIQGMASGFVRTVRGSYTNVVGLPLAETIQTLIELEVIRPGTTQSLTTQSSL
ncbi:Maf family protein [Thermodesulforhabdus norvegica]|uniref:dTTP/UTP pyrophosphatase n=1 Tax=Thermodesulforhabdus norvegica TaxID=39841 RepID=A0A1I4SY01_9BACT|nr:Maf family protein [Thermodesulforhabdus norvegica]SFM69259.1 septum formation protein [Thermodesulforhabdus norvegica]